MSVYKVTHKYMAISFLDFEGVYADGEDGRPLRRFVVTNWLDSDLHTKWLGKETIIKQGEMRECGHAECHHFVKTIVDKYIFEEAAKVKETKEREKMEMNILSPLYRKPLEEKTFTELKEGDENPIMRKIREDAEKKVRAEFTSSANAAAGVTSAAGRKEFEE